MLWISIMGVKVSVYNELSVNNRKFILHLTIRKGTMVFWAEYKDFREELGIYFRHS